MHSRGKYLGSRKLPTNYMADFTLMGFVVDRYQEARALLISAGFRVDEQEGGSDISISSSGHLLKIKALLTAHDIRCDFSDIADTLYQA
jgi:hypothetical protein